MLGSKYFIDTNVLVYANDRTEAAKQAIAVRLIADGIRSGKAVISSQVLGEFWVIVTRKIRVPLDRDKAEKELDCFRALHVIGVDYDTVKTAVYMQKRYQISYWDALILATARIANCDQVFSEDFADLQRYGDIVVNNPF